MVLRFSSKEEQILVEAAEERAVQEAKYAGEDWGSFTLWERNARALTQVHRMERRSRQLKK